MKQTYELAAVVVIFTKWNTIFYEHD